MEHPQTETNALQAINQNALAEPMRAQASSLMLDVATMESLMRVADLMASGKSTVPKHLQGNPADCMAVVMQAMQWGMNPFAVAQKTHLVNGQLGYEAQLVNAVVQQSNAIEGRFHYEYKGDAPAIECRVGAVLRGEKEITWGEWHNASKVTVKNSPLWVTNPKQQMGYLQIKNWARLYTPGAILGVYTPDEIQEMPASTSRSMGPAEVLEPTIDVSPYLIGAKATKNDADAAAYWKEHNGKFAKQPGDHQTLKDVVIAHRLAMKNARTVDMETGEVKASTTTTKGFDEILTGLCAASSLDALYVWGEWIETADDANDRKVLADKFEEMKKTLEAA